MLEMRGGIDFFRSPTNQKRTNKKNAIKRFKYYLYKKKVACSKHIFFFGQLLECHLCRAQIAQSFLGELKIKLQQRMATLIEGSHRRTVPVSLLRYFIIKTTSIIVRPRCPRLKKNHDDVAITWETRGSPVFFFKLLPVLQRGGTNKPTTVCVIGQT